jgi:hypothetical protein
LVGRKVNEAAPVGPVVTLVVERVPEPLVTFRVIGTPGSFDDSCTVVVIAEPPATKVVLVAVVKVIVPGGKMDHMLKDGPG